MTEIKQNDVTIIKAKRDLQHKVGTGDLDTMTLYRAKQALEAGTSGDFGPLARKFLDHLELGIARARDQNLPAKARIENMSRPVMELKANARMFGYDLISSLASIMLGFLEATTEIDHDAIEIVAAHHRSLRAIIEQKMTGSGGITGQMIQRELNDACNRYFSRRGLKTVIVTSD